ncbi:MAG: hypothetical protein ACK5U4_25000 [Rhodospirillales bacterium]|jgi:hypothetical protein
MEERGRIFRFLASTNNTFHWAGRTVAMAAMLALGACATPYDPPKWDPQEEAKGIAFQGLRGYLRKGETLNVLWVHGMCRHDMDWAIERSRLVGEALGLKGAPPKPVPRAVAPVQTATARFSTDDGDLQITFLIWSPLTDGHRNALKFDTPDEKRPPYPFERASLNAALKRSLLNDCFVDAVVYSGPQGDPIRTAMRTVLCDTLGGAARSDESCAIAPGKGSRIVLVAESLGSKILSDAVRHVVQQPGAAPSPAATALNERLSGIDALFLISNQVPLLDTADRPAPKSAQVQGAARIAATPGESSLFDALSLIADARPARLTLGLTDSAPIQVTAFSDPNDLLSYRLPTERLAIPEIRLANVIVSNAPTYFGWVERPDNAHCGYAWNPYVIGFVVDGYTPGKPWTKGVNSTKNSCFGGP